MRIGSNIPPYLTAGPAFIAILVLSACDGTLGNRTFSSAVDDVAITDEWAPANIILGDPQVFTRATLLNDRRREQKFIEQLIEDSRNQRFEPQLQRDLRTLSIAMAQFGVSVDPAARANFQREDEINELKHEVNKRSLQAEIGRLEAQIKRLEKEAAEETPPPVGKVDLKENALQTPSGAPSADATALLSELKSKLAKVLDDVGGADGRVAASDSAASPEDVFRDLQAYRTLLRAYEASNALDDTHDLGGNTFYRVQFRVTANPETIRDRYGVVEVVPKASISDKDIVQLYWTWLSYLTRQLNQSRTASLTSFNLLPETDKLFGVVDTSLHSNNGLVRLAVPPALQAVFNDVVADPNTATEARRKARQLRDGIAKLRKGLTFTVRTDTCPVPESEPGSQYKPEKLFPKYDQLARAYMQNFPTLAVILNNLIDLSHSGQIDVPVKRVELILDHHRDAFFAAKTYIELRIDALTEQLNKQEYGKQDKLLRSKLESAVTRCNKYLSIRNVSNRDLLPPKFKSILEEYSSPTIRILDVMPSERVQRVSTLSSAAASLQTALSVAAALPSSGIGVDAGFSNLESEIGKIEAKERVPLVIGFVEGNRYEELQDQGATVHPPRFGWVLGPPLGPDPSESRLKHGHVLKSHEVQVDLSLPAWWPSIKLSVRTAWAGPVGKRIEGLCANCVVKTFEIALPSSDSDMDALTQYLFSKQSNNLIEADLPRIVSDRPRIVEVSPSIIDQNAKELSLIVQGSGLWRGEEVFVYGVRQKDVRVLPDMSGLAVTVKPTSLPRLDSTSDVVPLAVFTRAGKAVYDDLQIVERKPVSASALALVTVLPYHINNSLLEIRPRSGSFPLGMSPKIAFRPRVEGQDYKFAEAEATLTASRSVASATVEWMGKVAMVSGDTLEVHYLYQPDETTSPIWSEGVSLVYYRNINEAAVTFDDVEVSAESTASFRMELRLPERVREAYPMLFDAETRIETTAGTAALHYNKEMLEVTVTPPKEGFTVGQAQLKFANPKASEGALPSINGTLTIKQ